MDTLRGRADTSSFNGGLMTRDFALIKRLNLQIQIELAKRPEYRLWWQHIQQQMDKAGPNNRLAVAQNLMFQKIEELNESLKRLNKELKDKKDKL